MNRFNHDLHDIGMENFRAQREIRISVPWPSPEQLSLRAQRDATALRPADGPLSCAILCLMTRVLKTLIETVLLASITAAVSPETPAPPTAPPVDQIVDHMRQHEVNQARQLKHYDAIRHYQVRYKGFKVNIAATMEVEVNYDDGSGKSFRTVSKSGSGLLCDKVLKRAVESEQEASRDKQSTALDSTNYRFQFTGTELLDGRPAYVLHVDPLRDGKFLYRGDIWVDAKEFAVLKIKAEPAKNPSFWITSTDIQSTNSETHGVWLPQSNRSESKIRIGGTALLTIDYGTYHVAFKDKPQAQAKGLLSGQALATEAAFAQQR